MTARQEAQMLARRLRETLERYFAAQQSDAVIEQKNAIFALVANAENAAEFIETVVVEAYSMNQDAETLVKRLRKLSARNRNVKFTAGSTMADAFDEAAAFIEANFLAVPDDKEIAEIAKRPEAYVENSNEDWRPGTLHPITESELAKAVTTIHNLTSVARSQSARIKRLEDALRAVEQENTRSNISFYGTACDLPKIISAALTPQEE